MRYFRLLVLGAIAAASLFGQKKEDFMALQRDVVQLGNDMLSMRKALDEKLDSMTALIQQSIDGSAKTSAALTALEQRVNERMAEQSKSLVAPIAEVGTKVNTMTDEFQFVRESIAAIDSKMAKLNSQVADLSNAVRVLQAPPPPPADTQGAAAAAPQGPPAGLSSDTLYNDALRDVQAKRFDTAMQGFQDYLKWFPTTDYAANAQFYVGYILYSQMKYADAVKAFDLVLEKYPDNTNKGADSMYMKGKALVQLGDKTAAEEEFHAFQKKYPRHAELGPKVQAELKAIAGTPAQRKKGR